MRYFIILFFSFIIHNGFGQPSAVQLRETALNFQRQGDYSNAIMVLAKALDKEPNDLTLLKDVAFTFYLGGDLKSAEERILPLTERIDADVQVFQIAGLIFKASEQFRQAEKLYKKALKKFSTSGPLYSEFGELLWGMEKPSDAIAQWESGINLDPSFSSNYYHASKFYFAAADMARSLVYGEVFVNLESYSTRTAEIKMQMLESYKRVFAGVEPKKHFIKATTPFETSYLETLRKQSAATTTGITPETLLIIRTRFVFDWFSSVNKKFPFQLFDHLQYLLREGMFEAYNHWLFGPVADPEGYQFWIRVHQDEHARFSTYQRNKLFRMPAGQHYF